MNYNSKQIKYVKKCKTSEVFANNFNYNANF